MKESFMLTDAIASSLAFFLFALIIFVPGYVAGWLLNSFGFRQRGLAARFAISVTLSIGLCPILSYLLWHWSLRALWTAYGACWISFLVLLFRERPMWLIRPKVSKTMAALVAIVAGWVVVGMFCLIDLQIGDRLYFPTVAYDYTLRTAVTSAIVRTGIPPETPFFFPGRPFVLHYHYFWFIPCSLVSQLGGTLVNPRHAVIAGTLWCGIGLMAIIPLYLRFFQAKGPANIERRTLFGIALLSVTGLDILPVLLIELITHRILANVEGWNSPVTAWANAVLWVPHHVAGLIANLTGFLVIWNANRAHRGGNRILAGGLAGLLFASAVGLSIYVTIVFAAFLAIWITITVLNRRREEAATICIGGTVAIALSIPYLLELARTPAPGKAGEAFVFTVREFRIAEALIQTSWPDKPWLVPVVNLLSLPLNYFLELGFFFVVGVLTWKGLRRPSGLLRKDLCGFTMATTSILICTFLRSNVISNNDLGWRGFLVAQFVLLLWGAELLDEGLLAPLAPGSSVSPEWRRLILALLALGVAGTLYEVCMVRFYPLLSDAFNIPRAGWLSPDRKLGKRTYAVRQVYEGLKRSLPARAIVQHNPNAVPGDLSYGLYADHQAVAEGPECAVVFGGDPVLCNAIIRPINDLFQVPAVINASGVDKFCTDLSIDALVVKDTDKAWADKNSWVWKKQPVLANDYARAFRCGKSAGRGVAYR
ncbi:MAG TPA: hypothetical protein VEU11_08810 [Terriglobales bacterium]|nr:hypothetical protein [Terriglobales bacterium]